MYTDALPQILRRAKTDSCFAVADFASGNGKIKKDMKNMKNMKNKDTKNNKNNGRTNNGRTNNGRTNNEQRTTNNEQRTTNNETTKQETRNNE